jgi:5-methylcytosine-specific restriction endonuclease McrA
MAESTLPGDGSVVTRRSRLEKQAEYREKNRERLRDLSRQWYAEHKETIIAAQRVRDTKRKRANRAARKEKEASQAALREARSIELGRPVTTRDDAKASGLAHYFTGKPCKRGHLASRLVTNRGCSACALETARAWYKSNRVKCVERVIQWGKRNPEGVRVLSRNRRARIRAAEGTHTVEDIQRIGALQKWRCHWCKAPAKTGYHVDHIKPLSRGGSNWPNNLCIACAPCNRSKRAKHPIEFARQQGLLL